MSNVLIFVGIFLFCVVTRIKKLDRIISVICTSDQYQLTRLTSIFTISSPQLFKSGEGRTDDTVQNLLIRHQEDRMDLLKSVETLDVHEAEQIHDEIMEEKNEVLTQQKRRLASMLASLQVQKSREVATLRGQLNALTKVEVNYVR